MSYPKHLCTARTRTVWRFALSFILTCLLSLMPLWAQESPTAAISVDGRQLFKVSQLEGFDAQPRADYANQILDRVIASAEPATVRVVEVKGLPVIQVNGTNLLTVTPKDTPEGMTPVEQAQRWRDRIEVAIRQAQVQRRPGYLRYALLVAAGCVLVAIALSSLLGWIWHRWLHPLIPQANAVPETAAPTHALESFLQITLAVARALVWLVAAIYISTLFPQTRIWSQKIAEVLISSLAAPILPLGEKSYSVIQLAILIGLFVGLLIVARSIKQLLRSRVLRLTGMSRGAQETVVIIANYTVIFIGTIVLLQLWGLDLSSLTIFAGVLGVGIGLGLQGIAKEFFSGLVIIFERPIQVGDFVNVGEFMGTVERISARSTEIRTLDQVSIIVPNSRFLEKEVVNWSHGSFITRIRLPVRVAYGSNLRKVRDTLIDAVKDYPHVKSEPPPNVLFSGYDDGFLKFELLVWITEPRQQFLIKSDLYFRIDEMLRDRNIEIPFPQQDLRLRSGNIPIELSPQLEASLKYWLKQQETRGNEQTDRDFMNGNSIEER